MKTEITKLALTPNDIVVVTVQRSRRPGTKAEQRRAEIIHRQLRKILPPGQRSIVKFDDVSIDRFADVLTPEELHRLNEAMERRLLACPGAGLPIQTNQRDGASRTGKDPQYEK